MADFNRKKLQVFVSSTFSENADLRQQVGNSQEERINGVTFMELKAILEKLDLLNFLINSRKQLVNGMLNNDKVDELMGRGLVQHKGNGWYMLSDGGRAFLNKYDVDVAKILVDSKHPQET